MCFENCHQAVSWLGTLERLLETQGEAEVHPLFRLWLTSRSSKALPMTILQSSLKISEETPKGIKQNLLRIYGDLKKEEYAESRKP